MPTTYAVASAKGGVGKTTTAANLAATLAAAGFETVAVDGDIGTANLAPALGVEVPEGGATLHDVLADEAEPVEATYRGPHGLAVMPGDQSLSAFRTADPSRIRDVLGSITNADYVVVDTGAGLTHESALPLSLADGVLLVSTPTRDGLVDTSKTVDLTERLGGDVVGIALNRVGPDDTLEAALAAADIDPDEFEAPVLGRIEEDGAVAEAIASREPIPEYDPGGDAAANYRSLASSLTGEPIRPPLSAEREEGERDPPMADTEESANGEEGPEPAATESDRGTPDADAEPVDENAEPVSEEPAETESDAVDPEGADAVDEADSDAVEDAAAAAEADEGDAVEEEPDADEDGAAEVADEAVLTEDDGEEEYEEFADDGTVEDAAPDGEEIGDDAIPFAEGGEDADQATADGADDAESDDEGGNDGGILSRLFR